MDKPPAECPVNASLYTPEALFYSPEPQGNESLQSPLGNYYAWLNISDENGDGVGELPVQVGCLSDDYPLATSPALIRVDTPLILPARVPGYWPVLDEPEIPAVYAVIGDGEITGADVITEGPVGGSLAAEMVSTSWSGYTSISLRTRQTLGGASYWIRVDGTPPMINVSLASIASQSGPVPALAVTVADERAGVLRVYILVEALDSNGTVIATSMGEEVVKIIDKSVSIVKPLSSLAGAANASSLRMTVWAVDAAGNGAMKTFEINTSIPQPLPPGNNTTTTPPAPSPGATTFSPPPSTNQSTTSPPTSTPSRASTSQGTRGAEASGAQKGPRLATRSAAIAAIIVILAAAAALLVARRS